MARTIEVFLVTFLVLAGVILLGHGISFIMVLLLPGWE